MLLTLSPSTKLIEVSFCNTVLRQNNSRDVGVAMDGELLPHPDRASRSRSLSTHDVSIKHGGHRPEFRPGEDARQRQRGRSEFCASRSGDGFAHPSTDREGGEPSGVHSWPSSAGGVPQMVAERGSRESGALAEGAWA